MDLRSPRVLYTGLGLVVGSLAIGFAAYRIKGGGQGEHAESPQSDLQAKSTAESSTRSVASLSAHAAASDVSGVRFKGVPGETYDVKNLAAEFSTLSARAEKGDLAASRTLYRSLVACARAPKSEAELKGLQDAADSEVTSKGAPGHLSDRFNTAYSLWSHCGSLTLDQQDQVRKFVGQLADAGDKQARLEYPMAANPTDFGNADYQQQKQEFVERAKSYLNEEIDSGNDTALLSMALGYMQPVIQGKYVPFNVDPYLAYEYFYAYGLSPTGQQKGDSVPSTLARLESQLDPQQIQEARNAAENIVKGCCSK
jgi:hypothetical protein